MDLGLRSSLEDLFTRHESARAPVQAAVTTGGEKEARFLSSFLDKRETVIRPVMEAVGGFLIAKGFQYDIFTTEDGVDPTGRDIEARIGLIVIKPPRVFSLHEYPGLTAICEKRSRIVRFQARKMWPGAGGAAGSAGVVSIEELNASVVQDQILGVLAALFRS